MMRPPVRPSLVLGFLVWSAPAGAGAQLPPPTQLLPPGFELERDLGIGGTSGFEATMGQEFPPAFQALDSRIRLGCHFTPMPTAVPLMQLWAAQPEDPASEMGLVREEPAGKESWEDGILSFRKTTTPWVGEGQAEDLVTWSGTWTGAVDGGLFSVGVHNVLAGKEPIRGWIQTVLRKRSGGSGS